MPRPLARHYSLDALYDITQGAANITASAVLQGGGADTIIDVGTNNRVDGTLVIDVSAVETDTGDEAYHIHVQGSDAEDFSGDVENLALMEMGDGSTMTVGPGGGSAVDTTPGRYEVHFCNEMNGTLYRYLRVYALVAGTIAGNGLSLANCYIAPMNLEG